MKDQKLPIDELVTVGAGLISDSEPKTRVGRWLRWIKKIISLKDNLNIKIKKVVWHDI